MGTNIFPKPIGIEPEEWYDSLGLSYVNWEYLEYWRSFNPPKLQTKEGYRISYLTDTFDHTWGTKSCVIIGFVFKGKTTCLGMGVWDSLTGLELINDPKDTWKLKGY